MKLVILPGNAKSNEEWVEESKGALSDASDNIYTQRYDHWDTGGKLVDLDVELEKLSEAIKNDKEYSVFAKSAGSLVVLYGVYKGALKPQKCVFVGLPVGWAEKNKFPIQEWLERFDVPTVIIQQTEDPLTPFSELKALVEKFKKGNIRAVEIPGNDHDYRDFSLTKDEVENFIFTKESGEGEEKDLELAAARGERLKLK